MMNVILIILLAAAWFVAWYVVFSGIRARRLLRREERQYELMCKALTRPVKR
jgi:hypothetical protein